MLEDMLLRMVYGLKSEEFTGELRKFLREVHRVLNSLPNTIRMIISKMLIEG